MVDRRVHSMKRTLRTLPTGTNASIRGKSSASGGTYGVGTLEDQVSRVDAVKPSVDRVSGNGKPYVPFTESSHNARKHIGSKSC